MKLIRISDALLRLEFEVDPTPAQASRLTQALQRLSKVRGSAQSLHDRHPDWDVNEIHAHLKREDGYILNRASVVNMIRYNILRGGDRFGLTYQGVTMRDEGICLGSAKRTEVIFRIVGRRSYLFDRGRWCYIYRSGEGASTVWTCAVILKDDQICPMDDEMIPVEKTPSDGPDSAMLEPKRSRFETSESKEDSETPQEDPISSDPTPTEADSYEDVDEPSEVSRRIRLAVPNNSTVVYRFGDLEIEVNTYSATRR